MAFIMNNTEVYDITYNEVSLDKVIYNGVIVWERFNLVDFELVNNNNGTYTITDWKGTYNGVVSTKCIVPADSRIIV